MNDFKNTSNDNDSAVYGIIEYVGADQPEHDSFCNRCEFVEVRTADHPLMVSQRGGIFARLDGYAIMPIEHYRTLCETSPTPAPTSEDIAPPRADVASDFVALANAIDESARMSHAFTHIPNDTATRILAALRAASTPSEPTLAGVCRSDLMVKNGHLFPKDGGACVLCHPAEDTAQVYEKPIVSPSQLADDIAWLEHETRTAAIQFRDRLTRISSALSELEDLRSLAQDVQGLAEGKTPYAIFLNEVAPFTAADAEKLERLRTTPPIAPTREEVEAAVRELEHAVGKESADESWAIDVQVARAALLALFDRATQGGRNG